MVDGIFNLSNLGWCITLGAIYYGASNIQAIPEAHQATARRLYDRVKGYPLPFIAVVGWLLLRILFALGWQLQLELLLVLVVCNYGFRQIHRERERCMASVKAELIAADDPVKVLGNRVPEWVLFPSSNRVQWLNTMIASLWPSIVGATDASIRAILEPLLEANRPSFVYGFRIKSASIGAKPMTLEGIQHHVYGSRETTLDISVSWSAEMDIRLLVRVPGPDVEVVVSDFDMKMTIRVVLGPHIPQWPCFANAAVSIVNTPELDFNITAAKISLDAVPGLGSFLDNFIRKTLVGMLAYPKAFVIPIVRGYKLDFGLGKGALGTLKLHFRRIDGVMAKYQKYKKTPFYCKLELLGGDKGRMRTASYTGFETPMKDCFSFTLYDNTGVIRVSFAFDVVGSDLHVGQCDINTDTLMKTDLEETELIIIKPSDASHTRRLSVFVKSEFLAFDSRDGMNGSAQHPPDGVPPRKTTESFRRSVAAGQVGPSIPRSRGGTPRASVGNVAGNSGTLFINVVKATNLKNFEVMSKSDPYVLLRINASTCRSKHLNNNLNPVFNFSGELTVKDWETDELLIRLIDKNVGSDVLMGEATLPVRRIAQSPNETLAGTFDLAPQGTVTLSANFLRHS